MAIIEVSKLTKYYGRYMSIEDVTFSVNKGEIFGLLGEEDAGKTTILEILSGKIKANSGQAYVAGLNCQTDADQISKMIRVVSANGDNSVKIKAKTVGKLLDGISTEKAKVRAGRWCEEFGLNEEDAIRKLSKENKIALYMINALVDMPRVLAIDDPFDGTSAEFADHLSVFLKRENQRGLTVILTAREQKYLNRLCTSIATIQEGRLLPMQMPEERDGLDDLHFASFDDSRMYGSFSGKPFADIPAQEQPHRPENAASSDPFADLYTEQQQAPVEEPAFSSDPVDDSDVDIDSMWTMPTREERQAQQEPDLDDEFSKLFLDNASGVWGSSADIYASGDAAQVDFSQMGDLTPPSPHTWQQDVPKREEAAFDDMYLADEHHERPAQQTVQDEEPAPVLPGNGNRRFVLRADQIPAMYLSKLGAVILQSTDDFAEFIYNGPIDSVLTALSQIHVRDLQISIDPPGAEY